jgi:hypothetical protein
MLSFVNGRLPFHEKRKGGLPTTWVCLGLADWDATAYSRKQLNEGSMHVEVAWAFFDLGNYQSTS